MIYFEYNGTRYLYERNIQRDIIKIYREDNLTLAAEYHYDAYGNHEVIKHNEENIGEKNPFRYRGYYFDRESGLYYCNSRYYNPSFGRFISPDSVKYLDPQSVNGLNLYAYCRNNPVMYADPSGQSVIGAIFAIIVAIASLAAVANDIYQIVRKDGEGVYAEVKDGNVHINNSYKILTGIVRFGYAFYLNYINKDTKDVIQGSTAGVMCEWELHNYAAWLGFGGDSARDLDIGSTIFSDGKSHPLIVDGEMTWEGVMSIGMRVWYILSGNPIYWIYDLIVNGGF